MNKIVVVLLASGHEVIGELENENSEFVNITKPLEIEYKETPAGQFGLTMIPFICSSSEELFTFNRRHVIMVCKPKENVSNYYTQWWKIEESPSHIQNESSSLN